ncbi:glycosyltransferase family 4 protein [Paracoccus benzoatiresistens]|uniref:Glycosyltransferase family 4 protein n=1 Tax=Paracoccus benzoatiresistens TaxID=2997341 RepID=A0ABT4J0I8_9RHOB|nr:glycosyltransferase family 4 protein [Paracoccus sp. EF6]MCZ0960633.1 glycosyltransferase family 4 protein [Paracoccus sp. EF6]
MAIRVLFPFVGDTFGGSHISALQLIDALDRDRVQPGILLHRDGELAQRLRDSGRDFVLWQEGGILAPRYSRDRQDVGPLGYVGRALPAMRRYLRKEAIDIVHTNDGRMHVTWAAPARLAGCRLVWHHRGDPTAFGVNRIAPLLADRILTVSRFAMPSRPLRDVSGRVEVVRSPFDLPSRTPDRAASRAMLLSELGLPADTLILGWMGILNRRKRPDHFVRAVAAIAARLDRPVAGLIFGRPENPQDPLDRACRDLAESLGIADRIHLMGFRSPADRYLAGLDALLITALSEPFGRTLIEAMHVGTPVVATDHGGNPEAITDNRTGFLVDPGPPEAFADPVLRLARDPDLARTITSSARQDVRASYGVDTHVRRVSAIYHDIAHQNQRQGKARAQA